MICYNIQQGGGFLSALTTQSMVTWVDMHALDNPTLANLSNRFGYSPFYCSTRFRESAGMTFRRYVAKVKLESAAKELRSTDDRIVDIAVRCGYSSHEAFSRAFSAAYQCAPIEYRRQNSA